MKRRLESRIAPIDTLILGAIEIYQRHISPRKGWRCAYSALHGGAGCSGAVQRAIKKHGWKKAAPVARQRFRDCKLAAQTLRAQMLCAQIGGDSPENSERQRRKDWNCDWCQCDPCFSFDLVSLCGQNGGNCLPDGCGQGIPCDCAPCDCTPCDCNPCI